jgi:hypothetical protein
VEHDANLLADLEALLKPKGDPLSPIQWTTKSVAKLKEALQQQGHKVGNTALRKLLHALGFSLQANKKTIEGSSHADRDVQFGHILLMCQHFEAEGVPIISVDCKKKELMGNFKNNGRQWQAKGADTTVNVFDYLSLADGRAVPYGVYDLAHNQGFINVSIDHDTSEGHVIRVRVLRKEFRQ